MGFEWDNYGSGRSFATFKEIGDKVRGRIVDIREGTDFNGRPCPELEFQEDDGTIVVWTVGQVVGQQRLAETKPQIGWTIEVRYSGHGEGKPGRAPAKLFTVEVVSKTDTDTGEVHDKSDEPSQTVATGADL